jgi:thiamine transporter ThiT
MLEAAILTGIAACWVLSRFNLRRVAGYATFWDIAISSLLAFLFVGTYAGMLTGILAGLFVSMFLTVIRKTAGYEQIRFIREDDEAIAKPRWTRIK